jgi:predicted O-methyltransferase YrrM
MTDAEELLRAENQRLARELGELQKRVRAIDASRWWRLHPRFLWRRHVGRPPIAADAGKRPAAPAGVVADHPDPRVARFRSEVLTRGQFTHDWFSGRAPSWESVLGRLEGRSARVLEIGSFEGLSTCYFLWRLPDCTVTAVDTFEGGLDQHVTGIAVSDIEERFDANIGLVGAERVQKLVGDSRRVLLDLVQGEHRYDVIYVDGSHVALDVIVDAALSWPLLKPDGTLVFDDYLWTALGDDPLLRPGPAIDAFLTLVDGKVEVVFSNSQLAVRKRLDAATLPPAEQPAAAPET